MKTKKVSYLVAFAALSAMAMPSYAATQYEVNSVPEGTQFGDIEWSKISTIGDNRDKYFLDLSGDTNNTVLITDGSTVDLSDGAALYVRGKANLIIGDGTSANTSTLLLSSPVAKDQFVEICNTSQVVVNKNGVLTIGFNRPIRFYNATGTAERPNLLVDGGIVNGNIQGSNSRLGSSYIVFQNGATLNRSGEANPFAVQGKTTVVFDNSTYNLYDNGWSGSTPGWGNHLVNSGNSQDKVGDPSMAINFVLKNGTVWNGAGTVTDNVVTYYDFSKDITSSVTSKNLTLEYGPMLYDSSEFNFSILDGSKVSMAALVVGNNNASKASKTGKFTFTIGGNSEKGVAQLQGAGATAVYLVRDEETFGVGNNHVVDFNMIGNARYYTLGDFNVGTDQSTGGTFNFGTSGGNNYFRVSNINLNTGKSASESHANINLFLGSDKDGNVATNSTFIFGKLEISSGSDASTLVKLSGATNTFTSNGSVVLSTTSAAKANATSKVVFEVSDNATFTSANDPHLYINNGGSLEYLVKNGATVHTKGAKLHFNSNAQSTTVAPTGYFIADGAKFLMDQGGNVDGSDGKSGVMGFITRGNGAEIKNTQGAFNLANTTEGSKQVVFRMEGTNGTIYSSGDINLNGYIGQSDLDSTGNALAGYYITMLGSGNTFQAKNNWNFGRENSLTGQYVLYSKSDDAANKNQILFANGELAYQTTVLSSANYSDTLTSITLAGNTILRRENGTEGARATFKLWEYAGKQFYGNKVEFNVIGSGNEFYTQNLQIGNGYVQKGSAILSITGGGSLIDVAGNFQIVGTNGITTVDNMTGGVLEYHVDNTGISAVNVDGGLGLSGILVLDFEALEGSVDQRFILMSSKNDSKNAIASNWIDFDNNEVKNNVKLLLQKDAIETTLKYAVEKNAETNRYDFVVYYTSQVPEPATYAAIFGAIALAFAAYRRRK